MEQFLKVTKKTGLIVDDRTNRLIPVKNVIGFCVLGNYNVGVVFGGKQKLYDTYIGEDKFVHMASWTITEPIIREDVTTLNGIIKFNQRIPVSTKEILRVVLLDGTVIQKNK